jgi:hypothetical protein
VGVLVLRLELEIKHYQLVILLQLQ